MKARHRYEFWATQCNLHMVSKYCKTGALSNIFDDSRKLYEPWNIQIKMHTSDVQRPMELDLEYLMSPFTMGFNNNAQGI